MAIESGGEAVARGNRDCLWDNFDPEEYLKRNYVSFRDDDRKILEIVRDFFADSFSSGILTTGSRGLDVGTGSNLYPTLAMLPFCASITLFEYSAANVAWLEDQLTNGWPSWSVAWDDFWSVLCDHEAYRSVDQPADELTRRVRITRGDILEPSVLGQWDLGTMFFVAESITGKHSEFLAALDHFVARLKSNAPFAMAFMEHSQGYHVGFQQYPAANIGADDIWDYLRSRAYDVVVYRVTDGGKPLRDSYTGMIVAHGRVK